MNLAVADHDFASGGVDQELADPDRAVVTAVTAAQNRLDPSPELVIGKRLLNVIVGAEVKATDAIRGRAAAGQDDDRQVRIEARLDPVRLADLA